MIDISIGGILTLTLVLVKASAEKLFSSTRSNHFYLCNYVILCKDGACGNGGTLLPKVNALLVIAAVSKLP